MIRRSWGVALILAGAVLSAGGCNWPTMTCESWGTCDRGAGSATSLANSGGPICLARGGPPTFVNKTFACPQDSVGHPDTACSFLVIAANGSGDAHRYLTVSPATVSVAEGDSASIVLTLTPGTDPQSSTFQTITVQNTHRNCLSQPSCQPVPLQTVNVVASANRCP